jgi:hypothetical protein
VIAAFWCRRASNGLKRIREKPLPTASFIDPPTPWAPVEKWQSFLADMKSLPDQDHPSIQRAIKQAEQVLAERARRIASCWGDNVR